MRELDDAFLSDEDLDLRNLSHEELIRYWNLWLMQAQSTNALDESLYTHGVFERDPAEPRHDRREPAAERDRATHA